MYAPETILKLKEPRSTKNEPFPYDRVKVIGQSPVDHGLRSAQWSGNNGQGVIITPLEGFASTIDEPYGKLQRLYDVEQVPTVEVPIAGTIEIKSQEQSGPSPEDVFAALADSKVDGRDAPKPRKPPTSPLDGELQGVDNPPDPSPLGAAEGDAPEVETDDGSPL